MARGLVRAEGFCPCDSSRRGLYGHASGRDRAAREIRCQSSDTSCGCKWFGQTFLRSAAEGTPPPVNAIDGLRAAYLAEAAAASLRLGRAALGRTLAPCLAYPSGSGAPDRRVSCLSDCSASRGARAPPPKGWAPAPELCPAGLRLPQPRPTGAFVNKPGPFPSSYRISLLLNLTVTTKYFFGGSRATSLSIKVPNQQWPITINTLVSCPLRWRDLPLRTRPPSGTRRPRIVLRVRRRYRSSQRPSQSPINQRRDRDK
jgi:hypothetical protein